jgi:hypothetical protein
MDLLSIAASSRVASVGLKSKLTEGDAIDAFRRRDSTWLRRVRRPRLRSVACVYVPYYLFQVQIADRRRQTALFAVDAVNGTLDPYTFDEDLGGIPIEQIHSRNCLTTTLPAETAWPMLVDKMQRLVFQTGFFRLRNPRFLTPGNPVHVYIPYWLAFYADGAFARLEVLDAVRCCLEGAKARALFENWLAGVQ